MFYKIINLIKINLNLNNKIIKTKLLKSDFKIINIFIKLNIVKYVKLINKSKNEYIIIINTNSTFKNFKNLYKPGKVTKITLKNIRNNNKSNKNIFIISTVCGILNNIEAENNNTGGLLILKILI